MQLLVLFVIFLNLACVSQTAKEADQEELNRVVYPKNIADEDKNSNNVILKVVFEDVSNNLNQDQLDEMKLLLENYLDLQLQIFLLPQNELLKQVLVEKFDLLFIDPLTYVYIRPNIIPILQTRMDGNWYSNTLMVTRKNDGLKRIEDLAGKRVFFGLTNSLHSYLWPMNQIVRKSLEINDFSYYDNRNYSDLEFLSQVISGEIDAVFIKSYSVNWGREIELSGLEEWRDQLDFHNLGEPIPTNLVALNKDVDSNLRVKIRETLLQLATTELFNSFLKDYGWSQLRIANEETYENVVNAHRLLASYLEHR